MPSPPDQFIAKYPDQFNVAMEIARRPSPPPIEAYWIPNVREGVGSDSLFLIFLLPEIEHTQALGFDYNVPDVSQTFQVHLWQGPGGSITSRPDGSLQLFNPETQQVMVFPEWVSLVTPSATTPAVSDGDDDFMDGLR